MAFELSEAFVLKDKNLCITAICNQKCLYGSRCVLPNICSASLRTKNILESKEKNIQVFYILTKNGRDIDTCNQLGYSDTVIYTCLLMLLFFTPSKIENIQDFTVFL